MTIFAITAVHVAGSDHHARITSHIWLNTTTGKAGRVWTSTMVDFIENRGNDVRVAGPEGWVSVGVVRPASGEPYLRTYADGEWSDNLLALPRF